MCSLGLGRMQQRAGPAAPSCWLRPEMQLAAAGARTVMQHEFEECSTPASVHKPESLNFGGIHTP